ncbi:MAG: hypothetical protein CMC56_03275 [Flavobacteriaceae bacterium]|nr:hypothetical protein [Flavobacteriaceae bacterium]|tara:strand:- start:18074 stop:18781 length:708 start_codon:yes stop_codon:yes gene_type:complete
MSISKIKKPLVLSILFFLPVLFLLFLYPSKHNYETLDVVRENIPELYNFKTLEGDSVRLENHLTVLAFFGKTPMEDATNALNLKELIYDKFLGFKRFQVLALVPHSAKRQSMDLNKELNAYLPLEYWKFAFGSDDAINEAYKSLQIESPLSTNLASASVFVVDRERHQRGRLDDRTKSEIEAGSAVYSMAAYNVLDVSDLKNKMSDDIRILFTEYRQKRKGNFSSTTRRANDLKQ